MNKNFHRIVFNASRGLRMVVQETARSAGKVTSGTTGAVVSATAFAAALMSAPLHAQIVADPGAPGTQRPTVLVAPNGVPLVNIQTPSASGVSRNAYRQFDIGGNGAILNNSRAAVQTRLGGYVQGNPWLATGSARVIVNEVNSANPSHLRGFLEVAGPRSEVIIANPAGIQVDGGGFINVNRATLTTGVPQYGASGGLESYVVRGGTVAVSGSGLDAGSADSLSILSRAFALSGALHASDLAVVAGANRVTADLGGIAPMAGSAGAPAYAIDVAQLGGMYANHIALVVNEAGVGARNAGTIQTATGTYALAGTGPGAGKLTLSVDGLLDNSGLIQVATDGVLRAGSLANGGTARSAAVLQVATQGDLTNHIAGTGGTVGAGGTMEARRLDLSSATGDIDNRAGTLRQTSTAGLAITAPGLSNTNGGFIGTEPVAASTNSSGSGGISTGGTGGAAIPPGTGTPGSAAGGAPTSALVSPVVSPGAFIAAGRVRNDGGRIHAGGDIALQTPNIDNAGGTLRVADLAVAGAAFSNAGGTLAVTNRFSAGVGTLDNAGGNLHARTITITTTGDLDNRGGTLASDGAMELAVGGAFSNADGSASAVDAFNATVAGDLDNTAGTLRGNAAVTVVAGALDNARGSIQSSAGAVALGAARQLVNDKGSIGAATDLAIRAGSLSSSGTLRAQRDSTLTVSNAFSNDGSVTSGRHTTITAASVGSTAAGVFGAGVRADGTLGTSGSAGDLSISTTGALQAAGGLLAAGDVRARGASTDLSGSRTTGANIALAATAGDVTTRHATATTPGTLTVNANASSGQSLNNDAGVLNAARLDLRASNLGNTAGGQIVQTGTDATAISVTGTLDNTAGTIASNAADVALSAGTFVNVGGNVQHAGTGTLDIGATRSFSGANGRIESNGALNAHGGDFDLDGATTRSAQLALDAASLRNRAGSIVQTGTGVTRVATAGDLVNDGGTIATNATDVALRAGGTLSNAAGHLRHAGGGTLALTAGSYAGAQGQLVTNGALVVRVAGAFSQDGGTTSAAQLTLDADAIGNVGGTITQTGSGTTRIAAATRLDNGGGSIASNGTDLGISARTVSNANGHIRHAGTGSLDIAATQSFSGANGQIVTNGLLDAHGGDFDLDGATTRAGRIAVDAASLSNRAGQIVQSGTGATRIAAAGGLDNDGGTIASNGAGLSLIAGGTLSNANGKLRHAGAGVLGVAAGSYSGAGGEITANDALRIDTTGAFVQDGGSIAARELALRAGGLSNRGGQIVQTGTGVTVVAVAGAMDNTQGAIASNGDLRIASASLVNQQGSVRAAGAASLDLETTGRLDNGRSGSIGAGGNAALHAASLVNDTGSVTAVGDLVATVTGAASNVGGKLAANGNTALAATSLDNTRGTVAAVTGDLSVTTSGATTNTQGALQAAGRTSLVNAGLVNTQGKVTGRAVSVNTNVNALDNTLGTLAATTTLDLRSGALANDRGLVQSGGAMTVDTHGRALVNTNAAGHSSGQGGMASGAGLAVNAGAVDNTGGFIGAKDALVVTTAAATGATGFTNAAGGTVLGQAGVAIATNGADYDNRGGKTLAADDLGIDAGGGIVRNSGALIRSGGLTTLTASAIDNTATLGTDQGIEGGNVAITTPRLDNGAGAIRADASVTVTSAGMVNNALGLMSAGDTLRIADLSAAPDPAARTLSVVNTGGTLTAGRSLQLDAATFSADGTLASGQDLSLSLAQDLVNNATVSVRRNLTYATSGTLTNNGQLLAGNLLTVAGRDVQNSATGTMRGDATVVKATGTLTNRGLIDGRDTRVDAAMLDNIGTGRIYGDRLSIAAGTVNNSAETLGGVKTAGTIAARESLDLGTGTLVNRDGALLFSGQDLRIGGSLDANRTATGAASLLENKAATIEALGNVAISANTLNNLNGGVTWRMDPTRRQVVEFTPSGSTVRFKASDVLVATLTSSPDGVLGWTAVAGTTPGALGATAVSTRLLIPSPSYPLAKFAAYYARSPALSNDSSYRMPTGIADDMVTVSLPGAWYGAADPIWTVFGVAAPARDLPADNPLRLDRDLVVGQTSTQSGRRLAHPVTQAEHDEAQAYYAAHAALDAATQTFSKIVYAGTDARNPDSVAANAGTPNGFYRDYTVFDYTATTDTPVLLTSSPGRIVSGGDMSIAVGAGAGSTNAMSQILAGRTLTVSGGAIANTPVEVQATTTTAGGTASASYVYNGRRRYDATPYEPVVPPTTVTLAAARQEGNQGAISGTAPGTTPFTATGATPSAAGTVDKGGRVAPIVEVPSAVGGMPGVTGAVTPGVAGAPARAASAPGASSATGAKVGSTSGNVAATRTSAAPNASSHTSQSLVVRTTTPDTTVPTASLFRAIPASTSRYLVETDPAFASYRQWLSSDYLLAALGYDPATVTKRLGDGFYEQRLIREQVAQLTGYRWLEGSSDDQAGYTALMNAGATFAREYHLTPGIALSAAQMAQLTSDIVWLVEQSVTLPDGSTQKVLVPQVYVRVRPGDIDGSGALLSAEALTLKNEAGQGDVVNGGTIAGRTLVDITADNVRNLGGRITGGRVAVEARNDLSSIGGTIDAQNAVSLQAGHDITIESTTQTAVGAKSSATALDRIAGVYVTHPGGTLTASAGHDVHLVGAILSNTGAGGVTSVRAGHDIDLGTVKTASSQDATWNASNFSRSSQSAEVGSTIVGNGTTVLNAGNDIRMRQATVDAGTGLLSVHAERNVDLAAGQSTSSAEDARQTRKSGLLSSRTTTTRNTLDETLSHGTSLSGGLVAITANGNITGEGVKIKGDEGVLVQARGVLDLHEARDLRSRSAEVGVTKRGIGVGTIAIPVPDRKGTVDTRATFSNTANATTVESANGGALLQGGAGAILRGVQIDVAENATIRGATVSVTGALDWRTTTDTHEEKKSNYASVVTRSAQGVDMHLTDTDTRSQTSLARSTIRGANVDLRAVDENGQRGELTLSGTTVRTPGTLTLEASRLLAPVQLTQVDTTHTSEGRDLVWQRSQGEGGSDPTANHVQIEAGKFVRQLDIATIETGAKDRIDALARQPGMGWIDLLRNDPALAGKVDWQRVDDAYKGWDYQKEGLTPEGAGIVTLVVAYFTAGAASSLSGTVGAAVGGGMTGTVVGGAVAAGFTTLMSQAALAIINNQGNLGHALHDLGSSANVRGLLTAIAVGGALGAMNMDPTGLPTAQGGAQGFMAQLGQNLQAGAARAVIGTAINGGSLEDSLRRNLRASLLDTMAAQGANAIGDITANGTLDAFTNKVAHAMAGCAVGAVRTDTKAGCGAGAIGAAVGEMAAEAYGRRGDTVQFASMLGGIAAALGGADAQGIGVAGQAGANAAAKNYLNHDQWQVLANRLKACKTSSDCDQVTREFVTLSARHDAEMRQSCQSTTSESCRGHIVASLDGSRAQMDLVAAGTLPANYAAGADLNAQANRLARNVIVADAACQQKQDDLNGVLLLGTVGLVTAPLLPSLGSAAVAWIVASPVMALQLGIISAETAAALATGAVSPNSLAEGMFAVAATGSIRFAGPAGAKNLVGGTTIKTLADAADSLTAQSAAQAQRLQKELSSLARVQPDTSKDVWYLANTDQNLLTANKFDMNHVLSGEINGAGRATGYHAELAADGSARIRPESAVTQNANGTYSAPVQIWDASKNQWINKVNARTGDLQPSTFFDPSWSQARVEYEVAQAFRTGRIKSPTEQSFTAPTPSGVQIQFFSDSVRTTFYPTKF